jgi:hypothetical protein
MSRGGVLMMLSSKDVRVQTQIDRTEQIDHNANALLRYMMNMICHNRRVKGKHDHALARVANENGFLNDNGDRAVSGRGCSLAV